jgi:hypothetical protein
MNDKLRSRFLLVVAIAGTALVTSSTVAFATAQVIESGGVIQACYRLSDDDRKGELRAVADPSACRTNESPISWSIQGPKGDTGPQGPQGEQGEPGISGLEIVQVDSDFNSVAGKSIFAYCPEGKRPIGGAVGAIGIPGVVVVNRSEGLIDSTAWYGEAHEIAPGTDTPWSVRVEAVCAYVS